jgi:hypothetical protein
LFGKLFNIENGRNYLFNQKLGKHKYPKKSKNPKKNYPIRFGDIAKIMQQQLDKKRK